MVHVLVGDASDGGGDPVRGCPGDESQDHLAAFPAQAGNRVGRHGMAASARRTLPPICANRFFAALGPRCAASITIATGTRHPARDRAWTASGSVAPVAAITILTARRR